MEDKSTDLAVAIKKSQRNATFKQQKQDLLEEFERQIAFPYKGGMFKATAEFLSLCHAVHTGDNPLIVLDINKRPVETAGLDFLDLVREKHISAMNWYYAEFTKLEKARTVEAMLCPNEE